VARYRNAYPELFSAAPRIDASNFTVAIDVVPALQRLGKTDEALALLAGSEEVMARLALGGHRSRPRAGLRLDPRRAGIQGDLRRHRARHGPAARRAREAAQGRAARSRRDRAGRFRELGPRDRAERLPRETCLRHYSRPTSDPGSRPPDSGADMTRSARRGCRRDRQRVRRDAVEGHEPALAGHALRADLDARDGRLGGPRVPHAAARLARAPEPGPAVRLAGSAR